MNLPHFTAAQTTFINQRARATMNEVLLHVLTAQPFYPGGMAPTLLGVKSFSDLHDLCDANTLGGWCDDEGHVADMKRHLWPEIGNGAEHAGSWIDAAGFAQEFVSHWIERGAMREDVMFLSEALDAEEAECLLDEDRWIEAYGMIDDRESRVGMSKAVADRLRTFLPARPQWFKEFPSFGDEPGILGIVRSIPPQWLDESWHNDTMPSFCLPYGPENEDAGFRLWIGEVNVADREMQCGSRFGLMKGPYGDPANTVVLLETDDWATMLDAISKLPAEEPKPGTVVKVDTAESLLRELHHVVVFNDDTGCTREEWDTLMERIARFQSKPL